MYCLRSKLGIQPWRLPFSLYQQEKMQFVSQEKKKKRGPALEGAALRKIVALSPFRVNGSQTMTMLSQLVDITHRVLLVFLHQLKLLFTGSLWLQQICNISLHNNWNSSSYSKNRSERATNKWRLCENQHYDCVFLALWPQLSSHSPRLPPCTTLFMGVSNHDVSKHPSLCNLPLYLTSASFPCLLWSLLVSSRGQSPFSNTEIMGIASIYASTKFALEVSCFPALMENMWPHSPRGLWSTTILPQSRPSSPRGGASAFFLIHPPLVSILSMPLKQPHQRHHWLFFAGGKGFILIQSPLYLCPLLHSVLPLLFFLGLLPMIFSRL